MGLNTMARDLKATLLEVEKEKERDRLDSKRKVEAMKRAFDEEQDDTKKQITDLQYDLLELRDAHAKLRTTNEKLRRDKEKFERERDEYRYMAKERSRTEQGEEKKVGRMLKHGRFPGCCTPSPGRRGPETRGRHISCRPARPG